MSGRAVAVVVRGAKVLLLAPADGGPGAALPSGTLRAGESVEQAAVRVLAEAAALRGAVVRRLDVEHADEAGDGVASYVLLDAGAGEPRPERGQALWVTAPELPLVGVRPEGVAERLTGAVWPLRVDEIADDEWPVLERLWQLYSHDLSEFRHSAPGPDGLFQAQRLPGYRSGPRPRGYLARLGTVPCGFALVRPQDHGHTMGEFFVTRSARGRGVAAAFARQVLASHPGRWAMAFQEENPRAAAFWRRLADEVLTDVSEQTREVPGKPHLPPDVWLTGVLAESA